MLIIMDRTDRLELKWTVKELVKNCEGGIALFDNAVQRGIVWDNERDSRLIRSIILNDFIPPFYASKNGDKYSFIDGKQRTLSSLQPFWNDEYELDGLEPIFVKDTETDEIKEVNLNGMTFSSLPEIIQDAIMGYSLTIAIMNEPSEEKECEVFYNLNNGKPLNAITMTRVKAKSRKDITELGAHELFKNALTEKAFERYTNEDIVVKAWAVLHQEEPSLETKHIRPLMESIEFSKEDKIQLEECFNRILEVHKMIEDKKIAKRLLTRTHMISIMQVVWKSIEQGLPAKQFMEWFVTFYAGKKSATISQIYNNYAGAGSARKDAVKHRLDEVMKNFDGYFKGYQVDVA